MIFDADLLIENFKHEEKLLKRTQRFLKKLDKIYIKYRWPNEYYPTFRKEAKKLLDLIVK